ncbi:DUF1571 domain-containing protein [Cytophagaceae bacterium ABcell3]|nr:DUF1571 domain-containing protein [Cytophagaceae bacterium ABcell3]
MNRLNLILRFTVFLLFIYPLCATSWVSGQLTGPEIIEKMRAGIDKIETLKFRMNKRERVGGKILTREQMCKYNRKPHKVYTKILAPSEGIEVLYVEGENKNKAYVYPNGFPYLTLSLDPYGSNMRKDNHHTVHEVGFEYINDIVSDIAKKKKDNPEKYLKYLGDTVVHGRKCFKVLIDYPDFDFYPYKVKPGENITDIAYRLFISDFMILEENNLKDYKDVKPGQVIKIPNAYARKTYLYIDQEYYLPVLQVMYDHKGLYAEYDFVDLEVNPKLAPEEFTKGYKEYNF